ncbi:MAG TPA: ABC transporter permease subunit [Micromonosporaceae bacterium]|jgi:ABC-type transport system involved in multi-copper enzyme maturation permease subunit
MNVLRSEWTKLRTQPSAAWALIATIAAIVGFGLLYSLVRETRPPQGAALAGFDPTAISLAGVNLAQLAIVVLGVLLVSNEYATGMIRSTLAAVPGRLPVLWGKATVILLTTVVVCVPATFAAFLVGQSILARQHLDIALGAPGVTRAVIGSALYLGAVGMLGLGLGTVIRSTAGAVGTLIGALFGLQLLVALVPASMSDHIYPYLPAPAGLAVTEVQPDSSALSPWVGLGVFCAYAVVVLALGAYRLRRRDA